MPRAGNKRGVTGLLAFITASRLRAVVVSAVTLVLPPLGVFTASLVALVTLREGLVEGVIVLGATLVLAGVAFTVLVDTAAPVVQFAMFAALPVLGLAAVLRATSSQGLTLSVGAVVVIGFVLALHLFAADPAAWWVGVLGEAVMPSFESASGDVAALEKLVLWLIPVLMPAFLLVGAYLSLLLGRWWHALLDNPGGFGSEFRGLRVDRRLHLALLIAVALGAVVYGGQTALLAEVAVLFAVLCIFQGLAVMHGVAASRNIGRGALVGAYVLMALLPQLVLPLLTLVGLADPWFDLRRRFGGPKQ